RKRPAPQRRCGHAEALQDRGRISTKGGGLAHGKAHAVHACRTPWPLAAPDRAKTLANRLSRNARSGTSSWRTNARCGKRPGAGRSSMAQTAEAVVTWIAVNVLPPMSRL